MCYYHAERLKHFVNNNMNHQAQQLSSRTRYDDISFGLQRKAVVLSIRHYSANSLSCSYNPSKCSRNINDNQIKCPLTSWYQNSVHVTIFIILAVVWLKQFRHRHRCWPLGTTTLEKSWHCFHKPNCTAYLVPQSLSLYPMLGTWVGLSKFYVQVLQDCRSEDCVSWEVPWADTGFALLLTSLTRWSFLSSLQKTTQIDITASQIFLIERVAATPGMRIGTQGLWTYIKTL